MFFAFRLPTPATAVPFERMINPARFGMSIQLYALIPGEQRSSGRRVPARIAMETVCFVTVAIACGGARYTPCTEKTGG